MPSVHETFEKPAPGGRVVVGVFDKPDEARAVVGELIDSGYPRDQISIVYRDPGQQEAVIPAEETKTGQGIAAGAAIGGALGGGTGLALALAGLALPGVGLLLAAGPLAAALGGLAAGGAMGGLAGSFVGLGVPDEEARRYERVVHEGGTFVSVGTNTQDEADELCQLLRNRGARDVNGYDPNL